MDAWITNRQTMNEGREASDLLVASRPLDEINNRSYNCVGTAFRIDREEPEKCLHIRHFASVILAINYLVHYAHIEQEAP